MIIRCNLCLFLVLTVTLLGGCSSTPVAKKPNLENSVSTPKADFFSDGLNSRYQWAIQNYEAGQYEKALKELHSISMEGPEVERYELVDFFEGMSLFHLSRLPEATAKLEAFLKQAPKAYEAQEARMTLLRAYEMEKNWPKLVALAAESDNQSLYFENRALLKLFWAEALNQLGEHSGAERVLSETNVLLNNLPEEYEGSGDGYDLRRELRGRYQWINLSNKAHDCSRTVVPAKGKASLLNQWADGYGECLVQASQDFFKDSRDLGAQWIERSQMALFDAWKNWLAESHARLEEKKGSLALKREVDQRVKKSFARFLFLIQEERKSFKNQPDKDKILRRLAQNVENLLSQQ